MKKYKALDLYCGAGGASMIGLAQAGFICDRRHRHQQKWCLRGFDNLRVLLTSSSQTPSARRCVLIAIR